MGLLFNETHNLGKRIEKNAVIKHFLTGVKLSTSGYWRQYWHTTTFFTILTAGI
jgi:hypothetical protein